MTVIQSCITKHMHSVETEEQLFLEKVIQTYDLDKIVDSVKLTSSKSTPCINVNQVGSIQCFSSEKSGKN